MTDISDILEILYQGYMPSGFLTLGEISPDSVQAMLSSVL